MGDSCQVKFENTGESFACPRDAFVLDAGLAAGLRIPHNCRGGACGTCKVLILEGKVEHGWVQSFALSDEERAAGHCLICQSKPLGDTLVLRSLGAMQPAGDAESAPRPRAFAAEVVAAHPLSRAVRELVLAPPPGFDFRFRAGMHLAFRVPGLAAARTYSLADAPGPEGRPADGLLRFFIARHEHGRSSGWLHDRLRIGDSIDVEGPFGGFGWSGDSDTPALFCAGGSGLAPILSVLQQALTGGFGEDALVLFSVRGQADLFGLDRLRALAHRYANARFTVALSREAPPPALAAAGWRQGRIGDWLVAEAPDAGFRQCYLAGPPGFVDHAEQAVRGLGAGDDQIRIDSFLPLSGATAAGTQ